MSPIKGTPKKTTHQHTHTSNVSSAISLAHGCTALAEQQQTHISTIRKKFSLAQYQANKRNTHLLSNNQSPNYFAHAQKGKQTAHAQSRSQPYINIHTLKQIPHSRKQSKIHHSHTQPNHHHNHTHTQIYEQTLSKQTHKQTERTRDIYSEQPNTITERQTAVNKPQKVNRTSNPLPPNTKIITLNNKYVPKGVQLAIAVETNKTLSKNALKKITRNLAAQL